MSDVIPPQGVRLDLHFKYTCVREGVCICILREKFPTINFTGLTMCDAEITDKMLNSTFSDRSAVDSPPAI